MKNTIFASVCLLFISQLTFAGSAKVCHLTDSYLSQGWLVHSPAEFKQIESQVTARLRAGLDNGSIVDDISGPIRTSNTLDGQEIGLEAYMFDDLGTDRDLMYGDIALIEYPEKNNQRVEIRWFDGHSRHIVFDESVLTCFSDIPPYVDNSVL